MPLLRLQHAFQGKLQVVHHLVYHAVQPDIDTLALGQATSSRVGNHLKSDDHRVARVGQQDVALVDAADRRVQHLDLHLRMLELPDRLPEHLDRSLHVGLDYDPQLADFLGLHLLEQILQRHVPNRSQRLVALPYVALLGKLPGLLKALENDELVARIGNHRQAADAHRHARTGLRDAAALVVDHGPHAAHGQAAQNHVADLQRTVLDQQVHHRPEALSHLGLDDRSASQTRRIGSQLQQLRLKAQRLEQVVNALPGRGRGLDHDGFAAPLFRHQVALGKLPQHALHVGVGNVNLVQGHNYRRLGRPGVVDSLLGLRHDTVVGGNHQDHDVGHLGAAGPHGREGLVARRVQERHAPLAEIDVVGADVLRDAAGLPFDHLGRTDVIQQARLAVVDVAQESHHRSPRRLGPLDLLTVQGLNLGLNRLLDVQRPLDFQFDPELLRQL